MGTKVLSLKLLANSSARGRRWPQSIQFGIGQIGQSRMVVGSG